MVVKKTQRRVQGVPQKTQMNPPEEEVLGMVVEGHEDTEVRGVGPDHLEGMEQWDLWDLLDQGIPGERWIIHHWGPIYFHRAGDTPCI